MDELQQLTETLDATRTWNVWRTADRRWVVNVKANGQSPAFTSTCLVDAMRRAAEWEPLPLVPRQVRRMSLVNFEARKDGSKWMLYYGGSMYTGNLSTKTKAMQLAELIVKRSILAADEWNRDYGWCLHKIEGVDFRFED